MPPLDATTLEAMTDMSASVPAPLPVSAAPTVPGSIGVGGLEDSLVSIEGVAVQFGLLPVNLARTNCSADAEALMRKLGRFPREDDPWLPVATLGPLLIVAHHNPKAVEMWGIPSFLAVRVVISREQYDSVRQDLVSRTTSNPLPQENAVEFLPGPTAGAGDLRAAFDWMIINYPLEANERERLMRLYAEAVEKNGVLVVEDYNEIQPNLGVALVYLTEGMSRLVFNPQEAPRQDLFPTPLLDKHKVFPVYCGTNKVFLLSDDEDFYAFEDEWLSSGGENFEFVPVIADSREIRQAITRNGSTVNRSTYDAEDLSKDLSLGVDVNLVEIDPDDVAAIDPGNVNHTPEELMHWVLYTAINARASDLHIEKYYNLARFRARIDGRLQVIFTCPEEMLMRFIALIKNYSNMKQSRQDAQDARFAMAIGKRRVDVRVAAVPWRKEMQKLTLRFLDKADGVKELSALNLSQRQSALIKRNMVRDQGLILVTGPTGSGKTTTLYALINSINEEGTNIHTIEDPIEYELEGINQTQIDEVNGINFGSGLRALLRADPDVILIGECRDEETATAAVNSALTGHLVLTTLHANDSMRAVSRLLSMGVEPYLLADCLALSQAQRLIRRLCNYCKRPAPADEETQRMMYKQGIINAVLTEPIYEAVGCPECHGSGYSGRIALMEMCEINTEFADLIEAEAPQSQFREAAVRNGVLSLFQEGLLQVIAGSTTMKEIQCLSYTAV